MRRLPDAVPFAMETRWLKWVRCRQRRDETPGLLRKVLDAGYKTGSPDALERLEFAMASRGSARFRHRPWGYCGKIRGGEIRVRADLRSLIPRVGCSTCLTA